MNKNIDINTVNGFGDEWTRFDQSEIKENELTLIFNTYFHIFPWDKINNNSIGFDLGCGSGRWAKLFSKKVAKLYCIDPSDAIDVAKKNLINSSNCFCIKSDVDNMPLLESSMDFGYSLGVLHHIPDTQDALIKCVSKLKKGAPFLVYLYYKLDNKPFWYKLIWEFSDFIRIKISHTSYKNRYFLSQLIALFIYFPLAKISMIFSKLGFNVNNLPLNAYRNMSFYVMRTDALDRFGTRLEQRYTKNEIEQMMLNAGLININFNNSIPYWCACGLKK
jgi:ubiquinone/menaquinone biosynthesis C-methylase UbiE